LTGNALVVYEPALSLAHVVEVIEALAETTSHLPRSMSSAARANLPASPAGRRSTSTKRVRV
jgi:hypothetical protein